VALVAILQEIVLNHSVVLIAGESVIIFRLVLTSGAVVFAVVISMIKGRVRTDSKMVVVNFEEFSHGRVRAFFSDGTQEVYFLEAVGSGAVIKKYNSLVTHNTLGKLQEIANLIEDSEHEHLDMVACLPNIEGAKELLDNIESLLKALML
jgi:hypothetical protein